MSKRVAAVVADMFEDVEFWEPAKALKDAGHEVVTVGLVKGEADIHLINSAPTKMPWNS